MRQRCRVLAGLLLLALVFTGIEQTLVHTDDGCVLETHCNACLLQLATPAVTVAVFALPRAVRLEERVPGAPLAAREHAEPGHVPSRGPPAGGSSLS